MADPTTFAGAGFTATVKGNKLTLEIDLKSNLGASASGKSTGIASTKGNIGVPGTDIKLGMNVYKPR